MVGGLMDWKRGWSWKVLAVALFLTAASMGRPPAGSSASTAQALTTLLLLALVVAVLARAIWRWWRKGRPAPGTAGRAALVVWVLVMAAMLMTWAGYTAPRDPGDPPVFAIIAGFFAWIAYAVVCRAQKDRTASDEARPVGDDRTGWR